MFSWVLVVVGAVRPVRSNGRRFNRPCYSLASTTGYVGPFYPIEVVRVGYLNSIRSGLPTPNDTETIARNSIRTERWSTSTVLLDW